MHRYTWPITPSEYLHHSLRTKPTPESLNKPTSESPNKLLPGLVSGQQHVVAKQQPEIPHNSQIPTIPARSNCGWNPSHRHSVAPFLYAMIEVVDPFTKTHSNEISTQSQPRSNGVCAKIRLNPERPLKQSFSHVCEMSSNGHGNWNWSSPSYIAGLGFRV